MTSIVKLMPFSGVDEDEPHCYMLQIDEFRFLLDCGWDEDFKPATIDILKRHFHQIDAVLLSYPDILHIGALPYLVGKLGLSVPIYATVPVFKMGQMFMYDTYQSKQNSEEFSVYSLDDVDTSFDKITQLKYSQTISLSGKGLGLQITPLPAGHMLGGTIWKIVKDGEEEFVYAVDFNHKKERHLNGCTLEAISRPHLLITDAYNAEYVQSRRMQRDEQLLAEIQKTLRRDGNVLITVDTAGRVLELAQLLDQMWRGREVGLKAYSLALLSNVAYNVVEFAKSQVEWMSERMQRTFEEQRNNPFQFKYLQMCHSVADLVALPDPKVVLASLQDMQTGFSRELFVQWSGSAKNSIILTSRSPPGSLARQLIDHPDMSSVTIEIKRRVKLEGVELEDYVRKKKEEESESEKSKQEQARRDREDVSSESEDEAETEQTSAVIKTKHDLMLRTEGRTKTGFFKQSKKSYPMFPVHEEKTKCDEYGEFIRPEDFAFNDPVPGEEDKMEVEAPVMPATLVTETPTKCVRTYQSLSVNASILFIDFEGRSDGESIKKIIAQIKPRQMVLVRGSKAVKQRLAEQCAAGAVSGKVLVPKLNELLDATTESHIYQVKLKDSIVSALRFFKTKDVEIAWVDAMLDVKRSCTDTGIAKNSSKNNESKPNKMDVDGDDDDEVATEVVPVLVSLMAGEVPSHDAVFVNEPRLSDFKQYVVSRGLQAEMSGGSLICNGTIAVRRNETGRLHIEGCISEDYYKVRQMLYEQFAIV